MQKILLAVALIGLLVVSATIPTKAATGIPEAFSYQGRLYDSGGNLLGGTGTDYCFKFSVYDNATVGSGTKLWPAGAPTGESIQVRFGVFNFNVGLGTDALTYNFSDNDTVYLQVEVATKVGGSCTDGNETYETLGAVLGGRQQIVAAGYAITAGNALGVVTPNNAGGGSTGVTVQSGTGTTSTGGLTFLTGNASGGTAGNISLDVGTSSAGNGSITIGTAARAQTLTIGNTTTGTSIALSGLTINVGERSGDFPGFAPPGNRR